MLTRMTSNKYVIYFCVLKGDEIKNPGNFL